MQADELAELGIASVVMTLPSDVKPPTHTPGGRRIVVCPAETQEGMTCEKCGLCAVKDRQSIVGFLAHGRGELFMNGHLPVLA